MNLRMMVSSKFLYKTKGTIMKTKLTVSIVDLQGYDDYDDDIPYVRYLSDADELAKTRNIGITSDRNTCCVALSEQNEVVGAAWVSNDNDNFTFDIAVSEKYEDKGIGSMLTDYMISLRADLLDANPESTMLIHVISTRMQRLLAKRGFVVTQVLGESNMVMGPAAECQSVRILHASDDDGLDDDGFSI